jgi:transposase-like protein
MSRLKNKLATSREQVREAYRNGATLREIGEVHGVSAGTVRNVLIELGETLRSRGRRKKPEAHDPRILTVDPETTVESQGYEGGAF